MGALDVYVPPTTAPADGGSPTAEAGPGEVPTEPHDAPLRRRWGRVVVVAAGIAIVGVIGVLVWLLWPDPSPQPPLALSGAEIQAASVRLEWDAPPDGPTPESYVILRGEEEVGTVDAPTTSFVVSPLDPNTAYEFTVVSVDGDRRSEPSDAIAVTTDPGAPFWPQVEDRTATSVRLEWQAPAGPSVDEYVISNDDDELGVVAHPEMSFVVGDLIPGATYDFSVTARDGSRQSDPAAVTATTIAPSPAGLASDPAGNTPDTIVLTWSAPAEVGVPTEYIVIRDGDTVATVPGDTLSHTDTGLAPATPYEYRVAASWGHEASEPTDAIAAATLEPPIADARLEGLWPVTITMVTDPGGNMDAGTTWTSTWDLTPSCDEGACDVVLDGAYSPPGFNFRGFTVDLVRDGGSYAGSTTAQITHCDTIAVENTISARLTVATAGVKDGVWVAGSWNGTLEVSSPYTAAGPGYCPAQTIRTDLAASG